MPGFDELRRHDGPVVEDRSICFLHVPKSGGTSVSAFLEKFFNIRNISNLLSREDLIRTPLSEMDGTHLLRSHAIQTAYRMHSNRFKTFSLVRNPIDRTISHFKHLRALADHSSEFGMFRGMTLQEFLACDQGRAEVMNLQTSIFGIEHDIALPMLVTHNFKDRLLIQDRLFDYRTLENALQFINDVDYIGTIEENKFLMTEISIDMGWPICETGIPHRLNVDRNDLGEIPKFTIKEIEKITEFDMALYEAVRSKRELLDDDLGMRVEKSRLLYESNIQRRRSRWYWNFEQPFYAVGIYQRESIAAANAFGKEDSGTSVAGRRIYSYWCGDEMFFDGWVEPSNVYRLRALMDFLADFLPEMVELTINGILVPNDKWQTLYGNEMLVDVCIPASLIKSGFVRCQFSCHGQAKSPSVDDTRMLGLHLQWIELLQVTNDDCCDDCCNIS